MACVLNLCVISRCEGCGGEGEERRRRREPVTSHEYRRSALSISHECVVQKTRGLGSQHQNADHLQWLAGLSSWCISPNVSPTRSWSGAPTASKKVLAGRHQQLLIDCHVDEVRASPTEYHMVHQDHHDLRVRFQIAPHPGRLGPVARIMWVVWDCRRQIRSRSENKPQPPANKNKNTDSTRCYGSCMRRGNRACAGAVPWWSE